MLNVRRVARWATHVPALFPGRFVFLAGDVEPAACKGEELSFQPKKRPHDRLDPPEADS